MKNLSGATRQAHLAGHTVLHCQLDVVSNIILLAVATWWPHSRCPVLRLCLTSLADSIVVAVFTGGLSCCPWHHAAALHDDQQGAPVRCKHGSHGSGPAVERLLW